MRATLIRLEGGFPVLCGHRSAKLFHAHDVQQRAMIDPVEDSRRGISADADIDSPPEDENLIGVSDVVGSPIRHVNA